MLTCNFCGGKNFLSYRFLAHYGFVCEKCNDLVQKELPSILLTLNKECGCKGCSVCHENAAKKLARMIKTENLG